MVEHYYADRKPGILERLYDPTWTTMKESLKGSDPDELEGFRVRMDRARLRKRNILRKYAEERKAHGEYDLAETPLDVGAHGERIKY